MKKTFGDITARQKLFSDISEIIRAGLPCYIRGEGDDPYDFYYIIGPQHISQATMDIVRYLDQDPIQPKE